MRFNVSSLALLSCLVLASSPALAKKGKSEKHAKEMKECTEKGGTWDKKAKKCDTTAKEEAAPAGDEAAAPSDKTPDAPAPE